MSFLDMTWDFRGQSWWYASGRGSPYDSSA
jgi:hypothetical protein